VERTTPSKQRYAVALVKGRCVPIEVGMMISSELYGLLWAFEEGEITERCLSHLLAMRFLDLVETGEIRFTV
jgi:hypothetical protein